MPPLHSKSAIAIIGVACRLPGASNVDQFWELVRRGGAAWGPVPEERLNRRLYYHPQKGTLNKTYSDLAALVRYEPVDRRVCPISDSAIRSHDAAHVTLCEVAAAACRHAGLDPAAIPYANTGVYVGHAAASSEATEMTYAMYVAQTAKYLRETVGFEQLAAGLGDEVIRETIDAVRRSRPRNPSQGSVHFGASMAAGLIAKTFALDGPFMSFNAACASSSRAMVQAVRALQLGRIDMAIVGGASYFQSDTLVLFSQSYSLSPNGSHPFSVEADGMIVGEGYVAMLLKTLPRAVADGDRILAVVPAVGMSSDGRGKSLWAPRQEGQVKAIERAYGPEVAIDELQYIEAHATSTAVGDVTEVAALTEVLGSRLPPGTKIPAGSAKLNVGHTLESAGLVGLLKVILAMQHERIPPAIDDRPLNPQIDWDNVPLVVPRQEIAWPRRSDGRPRRAGVDAFGIGGLNVHLVVDDYVKIPATSVPVGQLPSSGATAGLPSSGSLPTAPPEADTLPADPIAIIACGAVMPGALTLEAFCDLLVSGADPKTDVPGGRWDVDAFCGPQANDPWRIPTSRGGYVTGFEYDWRKHKIPPKEIAQASPLQFMILDAVDQALQRAGYHQRPFDRQRTGVVVGTEFGGDCAAELAVCLRLPEFQQPLADVLRRKGVPDDRAAQMVESYGKVLLKHMPILLDETGSFTASALASRITKSFDLMGGAVAVDAAGASSMAALACCVDLLESGDCEMMICVGAHRDMTPVLFDQRAARGLLPTGEPRSPLDARSDGALPGEGCGAVLLKRLSAAVRDGDPIVGIIRGIGAAYDPVRGQASSAAIARSLADSGISAADVVLVETTAFGKPEQDAARWRCLAAAYGQPGRSRPAWIGTTVAQLGDLGGASGIASILKATMEMDSMRILAETQCQQPAPQLARHADVLRVATACGPIAAARDDAVFSAIHTDGEDEVTYHVLIERGTAVKPETVATLSSTEPITMTMQPAVQASPGSIVHFDATARRRDKMRQKAQTAPQPVAQQAATVPTAAAPPVTPAPRTLPQPPAQPVLVAAAAPQSAIASAVPERQPTPSAPVVSAPAPATRPAAEIAPASLDPKELETFLVNFVVEHTGYPPEIVELDADLEADLGIDSIKKAQLFGELGEYFDVEPSADLSLDDFPTLRHVLDFLVMAQGASTSAVTEPVTTPQPAPAVSIVQSLPTPPGLSPAAPPTPSSAPASAPQPAVAVAILAPVAPAVSQPALQSQSPSLDPKELEMFLVNFVVEHTGYPPEIVELDADLEADLGIDSIKKAQLFGELGEYFDVEPSADLSLDDFPTLRHVLDFLVMAQGGAAPRAGG